MTVEDAAESLKHYVDTGRPLGHFLTAVVENDLFEALNRADRDSWKNLNAICMHVYNKLPHTCWGSKAKVTAWYDKHAAVIQNRTEPPS